MAHHSSTIKRIRRDDKKTALNHSRMSRIRTFIKKVEAALLSNNKDEAQAAFKLAQPEIMKGVQKGVLHRNTASRKVSRLSARVAKLS